VNAHEIAQRLCALALDHPAAEAQGLAYRALGAACFSLGRFQEAIDAFEKGVGACAGLPVDAGLREHGESPLVINGVYAGFAHTIAGDFDRGWAFVDQALTTARRIHNPLTLAFAHHIAANVQHMLGATSECARLSTESARIAEEHRLVFWQAVGDVMGGWACARLAGDAASIERMRRGLHAWQASGAELHIPTWHAALADGLLAAGAIDEAGETVDRALVLADERQERFAIPVLLRLKGMVADRQGDARTGQTLLEQAIVVARQQGAGLYQLRAACELAGLVMRGGDRATARRVLAEACDAVKGGASIACVIEAWALLSSLAR
jgi:tetratricopeptide (TPR) repeat protein